MHWMFLPFRRYADFNGRSRRLEYWMFTLGLTVFFVLCIALFIGLFANIAPEQRASTNNGAPAVVFLVVGLAVIAWLAVLVPSIAVQVRRFHDQDLSGWLVLLGFIPYIGGLVIIVFMCIPGTRGDNRYGTDPLDPEGVDRLSKVFG
jgi:uncharacterized membrane protein YhaH (DUF805 family)